MKSLILLLTMALCLSIPALAAQAANPLLLTSAFSVEEPRQEKGKTPASTEDLDEPPTPVKRVAPSYPESAKKDTLEGTVYLNVKIGTDGAVEGVKVLKSVREDLDNAAVEAMKQWTFKAPTRKGKAVTAAVVVPFRFKLDADKKK